MNQTPITTADPPLETAASATKPRLGLRLLAAALGLVGAFLVAEIAIRVTGVASPPVTKRFLRVEGADRWYHCYVDNPTGAFQPTPDTTTGGWQLMGDEGVLPGERIADTPWCVEYRWGSPYMRGAPVTARPAPGVTRIAVVGDSFVLGEGVPEEHTISATLDRTDPDRLEVLNIGQSGGDLDHATQAFGYATEALTCRKVILVLIPNDFPPSPSQREREQYIFDLVNLSRWRLSGDADRSWLVRTSDVVRFVDNTIRMREVTRGTIQNYLDAADPAKNAPNIKRMAEQLAAMASSGRAEIVVVIYPLLHQLGDYQLAPVHAQLAALARTAGLPVCDLLPAFAGREPSELWVHPTDHHPNQRANEIAVEALRAWLAVNAPTFLGGK